MKLYVSSKLKYAPFWKSFGNRTKHEIISSWIHGEKIEDYSSLDRMWQRYISELKECDACVLYFENNDILKGCLIEIGAAMALGKPVYIIYYGSKSVLQKQVGTWIHHESVTILSSQQEFEAKLGA